MGAIGEHLAFQTLKEIETILARPIRSVEDMGWVMSILNGWETKRWHDSTQSNPQPLYFTEVHHPTIKRLIAMM
jgi:hypothetical protein